MDLCLDQRDKEVCQLCSRSPVDGAQLAALSMQVQELISSVEVRAKVVGRDLEEINGRFDRHRGEINHLKIREKGAKEEMERLKGFVVVSGQCDLTILLFVRATAPQLIRYTHGPGRSLDCCTSQRHDNQRGHKLD